MGKQATHGVGGGGNQLAQQQPFCYSLPAHTHMHAHASVQVEGGRRDVDNGEENAEICVCVLVCVRAQTYGHV